MTLIRSYSSYGIIIYRKTARNQNEKSLLFLEVVRCYIYDTPNITINGKQSQITKKKVKKIVFSLFSRRVQVKNLSTKMAPDDTL